MSTAKAVLVLLLWSGLALAAPADEAHTSLSDMPAMLNQLRGELADQRRELRFVQHQVRALERNTDVSKVAFSVSFKSEEDKHVGPFAEDTTLIFDHIFTNIGNAYNQSTGVFTAPVKGVYQFRYNIFAGGDHGAGAKLLRNGGQVVAAYNHKAPHDINTSQGVSLQLEAKDTVSLLLEAGWWVTAYRGHLTTFSGHLLFLLPPEHF